MELVIVTILIKLVYNQTFNKLGYLLTKYLEKITLCLAKENEVHSDCFKTFSKKKDFLKKKAFKIMNAVNEPAIAKHLANNQTCAENFGFNRYKIIKSYYKTLT